MKEIKKYVFIWVYEYSKAIELIRESRKPNSRVKVGCWPMPNNKELRYGFYIEEL